MDNLADIRWTIREVVLLFFSGLDFPISVSTIQNWIQRGIFHPYSLADERDPRGSSLTFADVMALALLRTFFFLGMQLKDFAHYEGIPMEQEGDLFDAIMWADKDKVVAGTMFFMKDRLSPEQQKALAKEIKPPHRPIQTYTDLLDYKCKIVIHASPRTSLKHQVSFAPLKEGLELDLMGPEAFEDVIGMPNADITIDVRRYFKWMMKKLNIT